MAGKSLERYAWLSVATGVVVLVQRSERHTALQAVSVSP